MSLPLRITFEEKDYTYIVLTKSISKDTNSILIGLNEEQYGLSRNLKGDWDVTDATVGDHLGLLKAIGRNIKLRYRLEFFVLGKLIPIVICGLPAAISLPK